MSTSIQSKQNRKGKFKNAKPTHKHWFHGEMKKIEIKLSWIILEIKKTKINMYLKSGSKSQTKEDS